MPLHGEDALHRREFIHGSRSPQDRDGELSKESEKLGLLLYFCAPALEIAFFTVASNRLTMLAAEIPQGCCMFIFSEFS